ncbi:protein disulfide oxidoreductase [uncultured Shewanella sp.]|uniref:protein disulfide oxidoreductase n=1 Tax=uncultured Shewanella sp. TaxID=173975 RepID=UPI002636D420|nr:protein disulfide oxidoreductase [uncultured Shewanella sp.]
MTIKKQTIKQRVSYWLKQLLILIVMFSAIAWVVDQWRSRDVEVNNFPSISGLSLTGEAIDVTVLSAEEPVLVYFWGTWCPVCRSVSPSVESIANFYPVVSVAIASGSNSEINDYMQEHGYHFPVINDADNRSASDWSVHVTPTLIIIKEGRLQSYTSGFTSLPGIWWRMWLAS